VKAQQDTLDKARQLSLDGVNTLSKIVDNFKGLAFGDLDATTQADLLNTAKQFGISPGLLESAMKTAKQQQIFDNAIKAKNAQNTPTQSDKNAQLIQNATQAFEHVKGSDGYISPQDWRTLQTTWLKQGGTLKEFTDNFSIYKNPDNSHYQ